MAQFQGHAKGTSRINPLQAKGQAAQIIQRGNYVLEEMQIAKNVELQNAMNWLKGRQAADVEEAKNLKDNFDLEAQSREITHRAKQRNLKQRGENAATIGANQKRMWDSIAKFSTTAGTHYDKIRKTIHENEVKRGFNDAASGKISIEAQMGEMAGIHDAKIHAYSTTVAGNYAEAIGKGPEVKHGLWALGNSGYDIGVKQHFAQKTGREWGMKLTELLVTSEELIDTTDKEGNYVQIAAKDVVGSKQTADAANQLRYSYLKSLGLADLSPEFHAAAGTWQLMDTAQERILTAERQKEMKNAEKMAEKRANNVAIFSQSSKGWYESTNQLVAIKGAHDGYVASIDNLAALDANGDHVFEDGVIKDIMQMPTTDQPGVTMGQRWGPEFAKMMKKREEQLIGSWNRTDKQRRMEEDDWMNDVMGTVLPQAAADEFTQPEFEALVQSAEQRGFYDARKQLATLEKFTNKSKAAEDRMEMYHGLANRGLLNPKTIMADQTLSTKQQGALLRAAQEGKNPALQSARKDMEHQVELLIKDKAKLLGQPGLNNPTANAAARQAKYDANQDFTRYLQANPGQYNDAYNYAVGRFEKELNAEGSRYKRKAGGGTGQIFPHFVGKQVPGNIEAELNATVRANGDRIYDEPELLKTEKFIPENTLKNMMLQSQKGQKVMIPEAVKYYAARAPGVTETQLIERQFEAHGMPVPPWLKDVNQNLTKGEIDNDISRLVTYAPTPKRAAAYNTANASGMGNMYFTTPQGMRDNIAFSGDTGASTGPHADIVVRDASGRKIHPGPYMHHLYSGGKLLADQFPMTSGFSMREHPVWGGQRMHAALDYGMDEGTPIEVRGGTLRERGVDPGGWGNFEVFDIPGGVTIQIGHLADKQGE